MELFQILVISPIMTFTPSFFSRSKIQSRNTLLRCKNTFLAAYLSHLLLHPTTTPGLQVPGVRPHSSMTFLASLVKENSKRKNKAYLTEIFFAITLKENNGKEIMVPRK